MAYRLKISEPASKGVLRIGLEQIKRAHTELSAEDKAVGVHEARKCLKRIRALLQLIRPGIGDKAYNRENKRFRDIARALASSRDATVLLATATALKQSAEPAERLTLEQLHARLSAKLIIGIAQQASQLARVQRELEEATHAWNKLRLKPDSHAPLFDGLRQTYKRCRNAWRLAAQDPRDVTFHEWRKDLQKHWRHMRLFRGAWPEYFDARNKLAAELSEILGNMQDLALFIAFVEGPDGEHLKRRQVQRLVGLARKRQAQWRKRAEPRAERLCAEEPDNLAHRFATYWSTARSISQAPRDALDASSKSRAEQPAPENAGHDDTTGKQSRTSALAARRSASLRKQQDSQSTSPTRPASAPAPRQPVNKSDSETKRPARRKKTAASSPSTSRRTSKAPGTKLPKRK